MRSVALLVLAAVAATASAQTPTTDRKISPVLECVGERADGSRFAWFGYYNRNSEAVVIPHGSDNRFTNPPTTTGTERRPERFEPGRQVNVFRIEYPDPGPGGNGGVWTVRTLRNNGRAWSTTATAGHNPHPPDCAFGPSDLSLGASVDAPAPAVGAVVTATFTLTNSGPLADAGVRVCPAALPASLSLLGAVPSAGVIDGAGCWTLGALASGASETLTVQVRVDGDAPAEVAYEVAAADGDDPDSTPGNGDTGEDDHAAAAVTPSASSGGGDGGLESEGSLASLIGARVARTRARAARLTDAAELDGPLVPLASVGRAAKASASELDLQAVVPETGPFGSVGMLVTPGDLLDITNAVALHAADYVVGDDAHRLGVVFAALTPAGETYDHTKAICDRVRGSLLDDVRTVEIGGHPFVMLRVIRPDGRVDYAVSLVAYPDEDGYVVDSRYRAEEYAIAQGYAAEVLNLQVWGSTPDATTALVAATLERLGAEAFVAETRTSIVAPRMPDVWVRGGGYEPGALGLQVVNRGDAPAALTLVGSTAAVEEGVREPFSQAVTVPVGREALALAVDPLFDVGLSVVQAGAVEDFVYLADGVWTRVASADTEVSAFEVTTSGVRPEPGLRPVERDARMAGALGEWAGLFRGIRPSATPADLSAYDAIALTASGTGPVTFVVEKASIRVGEQHATVLELSPEPQTFLVRYADLERSTGEPFTADDVTLLAFYAYGDGGAPEPFEIAVSDVRFLNTAAVSSEPEAAGPALAVSVAPNPSRGRAAVRLSLPAPADVSVSVFDVLGREVARVADGAFGAGTHELRLDGVALAPGAYVVRAQAGAEAVVTRMTRVR